MKTLLRVLQYLADLGADRAVHYGGVEFTMGDSYVEAVQVPLAAIAQGLQAFEPVVGRSRLLP